MLTRRIYRDPWESLREFRGEMDRIFSGNHVEYTDTASDWVPPIDIREGGDTYEVSAELPGVDPKDIDVSLEDGILTVKGERKVESNEKDHGYTCTERVYGSFFRCFTLPDTADSDNISAKTEHGVLKLRVPKKEKVLPKKITVEG